DARYRPAAQPPPQRHERAGPRRGAVLPDGERAVLEFDDDRESGGHGHLDAGRAVGTHDAEPAGEERHVERGHVRVEVEPARFGDLPDGHAARVTRYIAI